VWSGGLACILGAAVVAWRLPELLAYDHRVAASDDLLAGLPAAECADVDEPADDR
jgi:hypothetical protein